MKISYEASTSKEQHRLICGNCNDDPCTCTDEIEGDDDDD